MTTLVSHCAKCSPGDKKWAHSTNYCMRVFCEEHVTSMRKYISGFDIASTCNDKNDVHNTDIADRGVSSEYDKLTEVQKLEISQVCMLEAISQPRL